MKHKYLIAAIICSLIIGCNKNSIAPIDTLPSNTKGFYILNEGNFMKSNSSLDFYSYDSNKVYTDVFFSANSRQLGDVANDIVIFENKAFIVLNNSHKIEIISTETNKSIGNIQLPNKSPRRIVVVNNSIAYVSNWNDNSVTLFNPTTFQIIKDNITVGAQPEGMAFLNGKLYVCNSGWGSDSTISVVNATSNTITKTIIVGKQPSDIFIDSDGELIVGCRGYSDWSNPANNLPGGIFVINSNFDSVVSKTILNINTFGLPEKLFVSQDGFAILKYANGGILKYDTKQNTILTQNFINNFVAYGISIDDTRKKIFVTDPKNYISNGKVYGYNFNGILTDSLSTGLIPSVLAFKK